jgi:hypothetical protein
MARPPDAGGARAWDTRDPDTTIHKASEPASAGDSVPRGWGQPAVT